VISIQADSVTLERGTPDFPDAKVPYEASLVPTSHTADTDKCILFSEG
jgi:hypothetical protein